MFNEHFRSLSGHRENWPVNCWQSVSPSTSGRPHNRLSNWAAVWKIQPTWFDHHSGKKVLFSLNKFHSKSSACQKKPTAFFYSCFLILHFSLAGGTSPALQCGTPPIKAPCNAKGMSSCDWILLNSVNEVFCEEHKAAENGLHSLFLYASYEVLCRIKLPRLEINFFFEYYFVGGLSNFFSFTPQDMLQSDTPLVFHVPVGQIEHSWPIIALTVLSTMVGCSLILWNSLAIT